MTTMEAILAATYDIRGRVLQRAIEIETLLDIYISEHFTKDKVKNNELVTLLLAPRISFDNKVQIFTYLVDEYNPEFRKSQPKYTAGLKRIIEERNFFAHLPVDFSKEALSAYEKEGIVTFVKLKNSSDYQLPDGKKMKALQGKRLLKESDVNKILDLMRRWVLALAALTGEDDGTAFPSK
jgi:hypothetical protein